MLWDLHMHTDFSGDSTAPIHDMIKAAIDKNLSGICITDHLDFDYPPDPDLFLLDLEQYYHDIVKVQKDYTGQLPILYGIEIGLQPHLSERNNRVISSYPFDFVIGSSHLVHGADPYYEGYYHNRTEDEAYMEYFQSIIENLQSDTDFDVYGHLDYVVRYGPNKNQFYSYAKYADIIDEILRLIIQKGKGIEVNTAGYKYQLNHPNPTEDILIRYKELGGEILTIGADAHKPEHVAYCFEKIPNLLKSLGFSYYTVFEQRKPIFKKL